MTFEEYKEHFEKIGRKCIYIYCENIQSIPDGPPPIHGTRYYMSFGYIGKQFWFKGRRYGEKLEVIKDKFEI